MDQKISTLEKHCIKLITLFEYCILFWNLIIHCTILTRFEFCTTCYYAKPPHPVVILFSSVFLEGFSFETINPIHINIQAVHSHLTNIVIKISSGGMQSICVGDFIFMIYRDTFIFQPDMCTCFGHCNGPRFHCNGPTFQPFWFVTYPERIKYPECITRK